MIKEKTWDEFRKTGLLLFINQILHLFGWAIVFLMNDKNEIVQVYPARVKFRGFRDDSVTESYIKISEYLKDNIEELTQEAKE